MFTLLKESIKKTEKFCENTSLFIYYSYIRIETPKSLLSSVWEPQEQTVYTVCIFFCTTVN